MIRPTRPLSLIASLLALFLLSALAPAAEQSQPALRLITYNVYYGFTREPQRKPGFLAWMQQRKPDIVALQELNHYDAGQLADDAKEWGHKHSVLLKENGFPTGITSRFPIEDVKRFREGFHHGLLRVRIRGLYVYVIHLHPSNWEVRTREVGLLLNNVDTLPPDVPVLLAGDFNTFSPKDRPAYAESGLEQFFSARDKKHNEKNLREGMLDYRVLERVQAAKFVDLVARERDRTEGAFQATFPTRIAKTGTDGAPRRLDYVFANAHAAQRVLTAKVLIDPDAMIQSDHLPVEVLFNGEGHPSHAP